MDRDYHSRRRRIPSPRVLGSCAQGIPALAKPFDYSDGDEPEARILEILRRASDLSVDADLLAGVKRPSWPLVYHLSRRRRMLLAPFSFDGLDVLELGAGMGALSRPIAEQAKHLTAVEGSARRAAAVEARLAGLDHWSVHVGRIEDFEPPQRYDVACLVGVLEYAGGRTDSPSASDPYDFLLARAVDALAPEGVLIVAIENALGIKYWTGAEEDHGAGLFASLAGYPENAPIRSFSRRELGQRLELAGLSEQRLFLPFPDYKLPVSVLDERLATVDADLAADLACFLPFDDPLRPRAYLAPDPLVLATVARAGLLPDLANSFLFVACRRASSPTLSALLRRPDVLAWHRPQRRVATETRIYLGSDGLLQVVKEKGAEDPAVEGNGVRWVGADRRPVVRGEPLRLRLLRSLAFGDEKGFSSEMESFLETTLRSFATTEPHRIAGTAIDAIVTNAVRSERSGIDLFDCEWESVDPIPVSWWILRNVLALGPLAGWYPAGGPIDSLQALYVRLCGHLRVAPVLEEDIEREAALQADRAGGEASELAESLRTVLSMSFADERPFAKSARVLTHVDAGEAARAAGALRHLESAYRALEAHTLHLQTLLETTAERRRAAVRAVIVHHRGASRLAAALDAWLGSLGVEADAIVVANGCAEPLPAICTEDPRVHVVDAGGPLGFGAANNLALTWSAAHLAAPDYWLFLNNDALLEQHAVARLIAALEETPRGGIAGPRLVIWGAEEHLNSLGVNVTRLGEAWDEGIGRPLVDYGELPGRREVLAVTGSVLLARPDVMAELGGWSELFHYFFEDVDLCVRARSRGWSVVVEPAAIAAHAVSATAGQSSEFKHMLFARNPLLLVLLDWPLQMLPRTLVSLFLREVWTWWARRRAGDVDAAGRQTAAWRSLVRIAPRILAERRRMGRDVRWTRRLLPGGNTPAIVLPEVSHDEHLWQRRPFADGDA